MSLATATKSIVLLGALAGAGTLLWLASRPAPLMLQGEVSADRYDISARTAGRVASLHADVGDTAKKGSVLVQLASPELEASRRTQIAAIAVAKADLERIAYVRAEDVAKAEADVRSAEASLVLTEQDLDRKERLRDSAAFTQAQLDVAIKNRDSAAQQRDAASAALAKTRAGASTADRELAKAKVEQAEASLASIETQIAELKVVAPVTALVTTRVAELGENFSAGAPLYSLVDMNRLWFTFNVREDLLKGVAIGNVYELRVPALGNKPVKVRVTVMNVLGQFATWRATRATGDFDLRTFEVRGEPLQPVEGLRPGMSAVVNVSKVAQ